MASSTDDAGSLIEAGTPLTRNHWFDGKLLRADDLARDQDYHREALRLANRAGGFGVVEGLEIALAGAELLLQPGLGLNARGELLLLSGELRVGVDALIAASGGADAQAGGLRVYRLSLSRHEALCGHEDVVGSLCERACVSERQRPYRLEGVRLRARRIGVALSEPKGVLLDGRHRRSQIASLLFARDDAAPPPLPRSPGGLLGPLWCAGAELRSDDELTLAYLVRGAGRADFVELWAGRRERMAAQAQGYWQRRTRQRPYADFIAQLAQFQCQLVEVFRDTPQPDDEPGGDCGSLKALVADLEKQLEAALAEGDEKGGADAPTKALAIDWNRAASSRVMQRIGRFVEASKPLLKGRADRVLIERGIVELPPAGFLPVRPGADVEAQVQALLGPGVRLKVCSAPLDAIGQLVEQGQHSARTSLLQGIADPADRPLLQLIVPDGEAAADAAPRGAFAVDLQYDPALLGVLLPMLLGAGSGLLRDARLSAIRLENGSAIRPGLGAGVGTVGGSVGGTVVGEGLGRLADAGQRPGFALAAEGLASPAGAPIPAEAFAQTWVELQIERDPFTLDVGDSTALRLELREIDRNEPSADFPGARFGYEIAADARLTVLQAQLGPREFGQLGAFADIVDAQQALLVELDGRLSLALRVLGLPAGTALPEGLDGTREVALKSKLLLLRGGDARQTRWQLLAEAQRSEQSLVCDLLAERRLGDGRMALRLRVRLQGDGVGEVDGGNKASDTSSPLASLQPDPGVLGASHARRQSAERALQALSSQLGDGKGFLARARRRLFGDETPPSGLRGPHDWLLFRRPVDALCSSPAPAPLPLPLPLPPPAPEPPPAKLQTFHAWVLRLQGPSGRIAADKAMAMLAAGQLPSSKLATLGDAGPLRFAAGSSTPQQTEAALAAAWRAAGFGPQAVVAALQEAAASADALAHARFAALAPRLGGGSPEPALQRLSATLPAPLQGSGADGVLVMLVEPPQSAPPAPEPTPEPAPQPPKPVANREHLLLIVGTQGSSAFPPAEIGRLPGLLRTATDPQTSIDRLVRAARQHLLHLYRDGGTGSIVLLDADQMEFRLAKGTLDLYGGQGPAEIFCLSDSALADERNRVLDESWFVAGQLLGVAPQPTLVQMGKTALIGGHPVPALTLIFAAKGG